MARELLISNEAVRQRMSRRWHHVLVDEFQDTSKAQLDLIQLLATDSLFIVGDGGQSIYSWRGAHVESMGDFVRTFEEQHHQRRQEEEEEEKEGESESENENDRRTRSKNAVDTVYLMENYRRDAARRTMTRISYLFCNFIQYVLIVIVIIIMHQYHHHNIHTYICRSTTNIVRAAQKSFPTMKTAV